MKTAKDKEIEELKSQVLADVGVITHLNKLWQKRFEWLKKNIICGRYMIPLDFERQKEVKKVFNIAKNKEFE